MFIHINLWIMELRVDILPGLFGRPESELAQRNKGQQSQEAAAESSQGQGPVIEDKKVIDEKRRIAGSVVEKS